MQYNTNQENQYINKDSRVRLSYIENIIEDNPVKFEFQINIKYPMQYLSHTYTKIVC